MLQGYSSEAFEEVMWKKKIYVLIYISRYCIYLYMHAFGQSTAVASIPSERPGM